MLAGPPFPSFYLFEQPLPAAAFVLAVSALAVAIAMRRGSRPLLVGALVSGPLLAGGLWFLAASVTTPREQVIRLTRDLVAATSPLDEAVLDRLLAPQAVLVGPGGGAWLTRTEFDPIIRHVLARYQIVNSHPRILAAEVVNPRGARVLIDVGTRLGSQDYGERPIQTRWLIEWLRGNDNVSDPAHAWRAVRIQWLEHPAPNGVQPRSDVWS